MSQNVLAKSASMAPDDILLSACAMTGLCEADKALMKSYIPLFRKHEANHSKDGIRAEALAKATAIALEALKPSANRSVLIKTSESKLAHEFYAMREEGELHILQLFPKMGLGKGSLATVITVFHVIRGEFMAAKLTRFSTNPSESCQTLEEIAQRLTKAKTDLATPEILKLATTHSFSLVREANALEKLKRIGKRILAPILMHLKVNNLVIGNVFTRYEINLWFYIEKHDLDLSVKMKWCEQLLEGFSNMEAAGAVHGDFNPANILLNSSNDLVISDWESARFQDDPLAVPYPMSGECCYSYTTKKEKEELCRLSQAYSEGSWLSDDDEKITANFFAGAKKQEIFSLGITFFQIFAKLQYPYPKFSGEEDFSIATGRFNVELLQRNNCPTQLIELIKEMVNADPDKRPVLGKIIERFQSIKSALESVIKSK